MPTCEFKAKAPVLKWLPAERPGYNSKYHCVFSVFKYLHKIKTIVYMLLKKVRVFSFKACQTQIPSWLSIIALIDTLSHAGHFQTIWPTNCANERIQNQVWQKVIFLNFSS